MMIISGDYYKIAISRMLLERLKNHEEPLGKNIFSEDAVGHLFDEFVR